MSTHHLTRFALILALAALPLLPTGTGSAAPPANDPADRFCGDCGATLATGGADETVRTSDEKCSLVHVGFILEAGAS